MARKPRVTIPLERYSQLLKAESGFKQAERHYDSETGKLQAKIVDATEGQEKIYREASRLRVRNTELVTSLQKSEQLANANYDLFLQSLAEVDKLRPANEYASKRIAQYEAQFGFLPDEVEFSPPKFLTA